MNTETELLRALRNMVALADEAVTAREESDDVGDIEMAPHYRAEVDEAKSLLKKNRR